jgi:aspartate/methionine/tyrosine aminotransferase
MQIADFKLERYFARWEFTATHLLCSSDVESYRMHDLLALTDDEGRELWQNLTLGYTEYPGHPLLHKEIAQLYQSVQTDEIFTFAGAEEAIFVFMNALLKKGDHVIATWPGYQSLYSIAQAIGAEVTLLPLEPESGWEVDLDDLRRALRPTTRLIVVNFPHNPTGALPDARTFSALLELAEEANAYLFSDEVYRLLEYNPADQLPSAVDCSRYAISLGVMSKAFGLPGLRIGWLATHDADILRHVSAFKDYTSICNSAPSEILALIALRAKEQVLGRNRAIIARNLAQLDTFFVTYADVFEWVRPRAGSIAFPRLRIDMPIEQFTDELVQQQGVLLLPGTVYDYPGNHFRIGFGRVNMPEALARLERFISEWLHL